MSDSLKPALQPTFGDAKHGDFVDLNPGKIIIACPRCCREMIGGRCVPCERDRRDRYIQAAVAGFLPCMGNSLDAEELAIRAVGVADAAIAAADAQSK